MIALRSSDPPRGLREPRSTEEIVADVAAVALLHERDWLVTVDLGAREPTPHVWVVVYLPWWRRWRHRHWASRSIYQSRGLLSCIEDTHDLRDLRWRTDILSPRRAPL